MLFLFYLILLYNFCLFGFVSAKQRIAFPTYWWWSHIVTNTQCEQIDTRFIWSIFYSNELVGKCFQRERKIQIICNSGNVLSKCFYHWLRNKHCDVRVCESAWKYIVFFFLRRYPNWMECYVRCQSKSICQITELREYQTFRREKNRHLL